MYILNILSALFAVGAGTLWLVSARVKTPEHFAVHVVKGDSPFQQPLGNNPLGGTYVGQAYSRDFESLGNALRKQSQLSAAAAACASIAAFAQAVSLFLNHL